MYTLSVSRAWLFLQIQQFFSDAHVSCGSVHEQPLNVLAVEPDEAVGFGFIVFMYINFGAGERGFHRFKIFIPVAFFYESVSLFVCTEPYLHNARQVGFFQFSYHSDSPISMKQARQFVLLRRLLC